MVLWFNDKAKGVFFMRIMGKNYDNNAMLWGAGILAILLIIPTISEPIINFFVSIRGKVASMFKK